MWSRLTLKECELILAGLKLLRQQIRRKELVEPLIRTLQEHLESQEIVIL